MPHGRLRQPQRSVLRLAGRAHLGERDQLARIHREPGRRHVALPGALASARHALHAVRARRAAADGAEGAAVPEARARVARPLPPQRELMKLTRRQAVVGAAAGAVGAGGIYELVDQLTGGAPKRADAAAPFREQHLLDGIRVVRSNGIEVLVPPLHHEVVTARVTASASDVRHAQGELESLLAALDDDYAPSPSGLGVTVAWGLPYFDRLVPAQMGRLLPHDRRAGKPVLLEARRFPSDPPDTRLERNEVAILLRSDVRAHILD